MHPSLAPHLHEDCLDLIEQLNSCHTEIFRCRLETLSSLLIAVHPFAKYLGKCNDIKRALQECLNKEDLKRRRRNLEEAKQRQTRLKEFCKEQQQTETGKQ